MKTYFPSNYVAGVGHDYERWMKTREYKQNRNDHYKRKVKHKNASVILGKRCR